jgi:hypothetical protein
LSAGGGGGDEYMGIAPAPPDIMGSEPPACCSMASCGFWAMICIMRSSFVFFLLTLLGLHPLTAFALALLDLLDFASGRC